MRHTPLIPARFATACAMLALCAFAFAPLTAGAQPASAPDTAAASAAATAAPVDSASAPAAPAPMATSPTVKETVDNPYGLGALTHDSGLARVVDQAVGAPAQDDEGRAARCLNQMIALV